MQKLTIEDIKDLFEKRDKDVNKGDFGIVGILGGSKNYNGALKLAALSASSLKSGAGVVRVIVKEDLLSLIGPGILEQILFPLKQNLSNLSDALKNIDCLAIGMGLTTSDISKKILKKVLTEFKGKLIMDADALNILSENLNWLKTSDCKIILTPHLKEFSRLTKKSIEEIKANKEKIAIDFAHENNVLLLLKGSTTIITDGKNCVFTTEGSPGMATAGSGDVLAGILAGLLAYNDYNLKTVAAGAILAGVAGSMAAEKYTDIAMTSSNTVEFIPMAIKKIRGDSL